jgi:hypothetical protein
VGGVVGFTMLWLTLVVGIYLAGRSNRFATTRLEEAASQVVVAMIITYEVQAYGDMGMQAWSGVFLLGLALAAAGRLALATGAWPAPGRARARCR